MFLKKKLKEPKKPKEKKQKLKKEKVVKNKKSNNVKTNQNPKKPVSKLSKQERIALKKRIQFIKSSKKNSVQKFIPYLDLYKNGICQLSYNTFSRCIQFYDTNYEIASEDKQEDIFSKYCDLLNFFDDSVKFQLTFENQNVNTSKLLKDLIIPNIEPDDGLNSIREEYSTILQDQLLQGTNGRKMKKYITYTVEASNLKEATSKLDNIGNEILAFMKTLGVKASILNGEKRLNSLYRSLNPYTKESFIFDWQEKLKSGLSTKDFIAPSSLQFKKTTFEIGKNYGSVVSMNILAGELSDRILKDFLNDKNIVSVNMHCKPFDQVEALKFTRKKLTDVEKMKIDEQKKANRSGYDPDILPPNIKMYIEELEKLLTDLNSKNERLFHITFTVRYYATTEKQLNLYREKISRICQKNNCKLFPLEFLQEQAFASSLPLGVNTVPISRDLPTSALAVFVPFTTEEIYQGGKATYYGVNSLSKNMIMALRSRLKNPNGLFLGVPGSGKSFAVKREIIDNFLKTLDDIFISDPEGEYFPLVNRLGGQVIKISSDSKDFINPMEINIEAMEGEDLIANKSSFILSLCELIAGGKIGLEPIERSAIDFAVRKVYEKFYANNPSEETMPTLADLHKELKKLDNAKRVADSMDMYVTGSHKFFNNRSNVDIKNRLVCFDVKDLNLELRKIGMLIIQDAVWNKVAKNRYKGTKTWYYMDEFHLLLQHEQTAIYSVEMWKRFRKWNGFPTGITQNIKDLLQTQQIESIFDNTDFICMLSQADGDRDIIMNKKNLSKEQIEYVTNSTEGEGLIIYGKSVLPFKDKFPTDTELFKLLNTKPSSVKLIK